MADQSGPRRTETAPFSPIRGLISDSDSQSYPPLEPQEDLQTVGHQLNHSVRLGDSSQTQTHRVTLLWSLRKTSRLLATNCTIQSDKGTRFGLRSQVDLQTVGNQPHHSVRLGDPFDSEREVVPLLWSSRKTSRSLAPNRTTQSDYGTHFGLRSDVVPLLWSSRKTSRPLAPIGTTQSDYGTHFGLRRDVVPLLWSSRKTSRPLATNRHTQSDYGTHFGLRRDVVPLIWSSRKTSRPLANNRTIQSD
ncbi:unnamed protein product [Boreogadus saida]